MRALAFSFFPTASDPCFGLRHLTMSRRSGRQLPTANDIAGLLEGRAKRGPTRGPRIGTCMTFTLTCAKRSSTLTDEVVSSGPVIHCFVHFLGEDKSLPSVKAFVTEIISSKLEPECISMRGDPSGM